MSAEQNTLERSALERKDREELTTIAQALGAKPPSRARKADIVQLILELTGVESGGGETNGRKEVAVDDADSPASSETAGDADTPAGAEDASPPSPSSYDEEPPSEWEMEFGGTTDVPDTPAAAATPASAGGSSADNGKANGEAPEDAAFTEAGGAGAAPPTGTGEGGASGQGGDAKAVDR